MSDTWSEEVVKELMDERAHESSTKKFHRGVMQEAKECIININEEIDNLGKEKDRILEIIPALTKLISSKSENEKSVAIDKLEELNIERGFRSLEDMLNIQKHRLGEIEKKLERLDTEKIWKEYTVSSKRMQLHGNCLSIDLEEEIDRLCEEKARQVKI